MYKFERITLQYLSMKNLFWHLSPEQPKDEGLAFEIEKVENILPFPEDLDQDYYRSLIKGCIVQSEVKLLPALLGGALELEEYELAAFIKRRMELLKVYKLKTFENIL